MSDLEDDEELSLQDDAENAEEVAEEENTSEIAEISGDNTENQEVFSDGSEGGESATANEQYQLNLIYEGTSGSNWWKWCQNGRRIIRWPGYCAGCLQ